MDIENCPNCGYSASVGWTRTSLATQGWTTDCNDCVHGPRVTRFTREESIQAWNRLVKQAHENKGTA